MKKLITIVTICFLAISIQAQKEKDTKEKENSEEIAKDYLDRVQTIDTTLETLYAVISGEKGAKRNWKLFKYLFASGAKLIPSGKNSEGKHLVSYLSPDDYIKKSEKWLKEQGFYEKEVYRSVSTYGNIAQVFSTYEAYNSHIDETPFMRGINSIQLLYDEERWWIVNIYWTQESEDNPIPEIYLPKKSTRTYNHF